jgi:signal transduction histidine kinase/HAMP domain-containing protein
MPRLTLKTKLVLAITGMVLALVLALSCIYVSQLIDQRLTEADANASFVAHQVLEAARKPLEAVPILSPDASDDTAKMHLAMAAVLQSDAGLNSLLQSVIGYSPTIYDVSIVDRDSRAVLHSDAAWLDRALPKRPDFRGLIRAGFLRQVAVIYGQPTVDEVRLPIQRDGAPFGEIRIGLSTVFLKNELRPTLNRALIFSAISVLISLALAAGLSSRALQPLEAIARRLDAMTVEVAPSEPEPPRKTDEYGAVNTRIDRLGRKIRDVKEIFSALKENLDQIMGALQDGLMLFTREENLVLVSASAERFAGRHRAEILGKRVDEIFDDSTLLGRIVLDSFALRQPISKREIEIENGRRIQLSLDFIAERGQPIGALLTMRDAESVHRIENEIELSRRLAAIGRLTSGVAHEVKNPINAIVIHLEILRERLLQLDPETRRHMDIIASEIQRLDRVVKTLVDFTRPIDLRLAEADLRKLMEEVASLAEPEARQQGVQIVRQEDAQPLPARIDSDLLKQALLNVVLNGVQAMPQGGTLSLSSRAQGNTARLEIRDQGGGIDPAIRDKIFNLYFTTKKSGSGIGLAVSYRVLQLHNGTLEFDSETGKGTTFHFILPLARGADAGGEKIAAESRGA